MISILKKQLSRERSMLAELINRFGGDTSLWGAHDRVSVELDYRRGAGVPEKEKRETNSSNIKI